MDVIPRAAVAAQPSADPRLSVVACRFLGMKQRPPSDTGSGTVPGAVPVGASVVTHRPVHGAVPSAAMPDAAMPAAAMPAAAMPAAAIPDAAIPDAAIPDLATPDAAIPDAAIPDAAIPDLATPDAAIPDAAIPDAAIPDLATPDAQVRQATMPDLAVPGTALGAFSDAGIGSVADDGSAWAGLLRAVEAVSGEST